MKPIIIIGTGLAGYTLAREVKKLNADVPIKLITRDSGHSYSKPQLSAAFANGKTSESLIMMGVDKMRAQYTEVLTNTIVRNIDVDRKVVVCEDGEHEYEKCVLATGASVISPMLNGDAADDVLSVNSLDDYAVFREKLEGKKTVGLIGAGLIGTEFACDLVAAGFKVHVVALGETPLDRCVPAEVGEVLAEKIEGQGVSWHFGDSITEVDRDGDQLNCLLASGDSLKVDVLVSAIGIRPDLTLAHELGLNTNRGIIVSDIFETSAKDVFALGDCVEFQGVVRPYIAPIFNAARHLSKTLLGEPSVVEFPPMPVVVKTPVFPTTFVMPGHELKGEWVVDKTDSGIKAEFFDESKKLKGFVLCGDRNKERLQLVGELS